MFGFHCGKGQIQTSFCLRVQTRLANIHKNEFIAHDRKSSSLRKKTLKIKCKKNFRMFRQNYLKYESVQLHPAVIKFTPFCLLLLMQQKMRVHSILRTWYKKSVCKVNFKVHKYCTDLPT